MNQINAQGLNKSPDTPEFTQSLDDDQLLEIFMKYKEDQNKGT